MQGGGPRGEFLSISLLGLPEVNLGRRSLRFGRKKALVLLFYQAAAGEKRPRRELADFLWPKSEEPRVRTDLCNILTSLKKTLEEGGIGDHGHGERQIPSPLTVTC
jgi:DNA-binding SARP family transcriptional activator